MNENVFLIIDEGDMSFHPEWQQKWINILVNMIMGVFPEKKFQIIVSTHSPFILSDLPSRNVLLLDGSMRVSVEDLNLTFGSNIQDLLTHNFFIKSGLTGTFAKNKINKTIDSLLDNPTSITLDYSKKVINLIGEPLVRKKVHDLFIEKSNDITSLETRIKNLEEQLQILLEDKKDS